MTNQTRPAEHSGVNPEKFKVTIARDPNIVKERAREMGEAQFEQNKRNSWLRRTFLYNRLPDFFRQKEIINARKKIESSGNIYADQTDDRAAYEAAIASTLQRLGSDYEDDFILREGETRRPANKAELLQIAHIISGYARGGKNKEWLEEQTTALLTTLYPDNKEEIFNNIIDVAKTIRESDIQYQSIDQLCALLDVTIANASTGISSEVHQSKVDRLVQTISERGIFKFVQADTAVLATAFALSAGSAVASGTTRSSLNVLLPMAGTALVGGTIGAMRQRTEFSRQLKQHQRDITLGKKRKNEEEHGVRAEMEKGEALFETKEAHGETGIIRTLERQLEAYSTSTPEHKATALSDMLDSLGDLLARQHIAQVGFVQTKDKQIVSPNAFGIYRNENGEIRRLTTEELAQSSKVELISYSSLTEYSKEKDQLDLLKAKILTTLKRESQNAGPLRDVLSLAGKPMSEYLTELRNTHLIQLLAGNENSRGIQETVQNIDTLRKRATRNGALKGVIYGAAAGAVASIASQEIRALFDDKKIGTLETLTTRRPIDSRGKSFTFLEGLRRSAAGVKAESHTISLGVADSDAAIKFPDTVSIEKTGPGTFEVSNGTDSASNIHIDENGIVSEASKERLVTLGINIHEQKVPVSGSVRTESVSARDFLHNIVESAQNKYHAFAGHVKAIDRLYSKEDVVYKHGEKLSWAYRNNEFVAKLPLPKPDEKLRDGSDMYWNENVVTNHFRLLLQVSKDTPDKVIEVPVRINGGFIEAHIPADHPARALLETPNGFDGVFKGAQAELAYQSGTTHNGSMQTYETYYKEQYGDGPKELEELVQSSMPTKKTLLVFELNEHKANWPNSVLGATPARKTIDEAVNKNKTSTAVHPTKPTENEITGETAETARPEFSLMTETDIPTDTTEQDTVDLKLLLEKIKERLANRGYSKENLAEFLHILNSVRDDGSTLESYAISEDKMGIRIVRPPAPQNEQAPVKLINESNPLKQLETATLAFKEAYEAVSSDIAEGANKAILIININILLKNEAPLLEKIKIAQSIRKALLEAKPELQLPEIPATSDVQKFIQEKVKIYSTSDFYQQIETRLEKLRDLLSPDELRAITTNVSLLQDLVNKVKNALPTQTETRNISTAGMNVEAELQSLERRYTPEVEIKSEILKKAVKRKEELEQLNVFVTERADTDSKSVFIEGASLGGNRKDNGSTAEKIVHNEDSAVLVASDRLFCAGVIDGMGGYDGGDVASAHLQSILKERLSLAVNSTNTPDSESILQLIEEAMTETTKRLDQQGLHEANAVATITFGIPKVQNNGSIQWDCYAAHIGDTRLYSLAPNGSFEQRTNDHGPVGYRVKIGDLTEDEALIAPNKNQVWKDIRDKADETGYRFEVVNLGVVESGTRLYLFSDGISDQFYKRELEEMVKENASAADIAAAADVRSNENLPYSKRYKRTNGSQYPDDATAIIVTLGAPTLKTRAVEQQTGTQTTKGESAPANEMK